MVHTAMGWIDMGEDPEPPPPVTAEAVIEIGKVFEGHSRRYAGVKASCSACGYTTYTGGDPDRDWSHILDSHLAQHQPGRALDIEVDWTPSALCSVCEDGIGDIHAEDDGLICRECGTQWDIDGTGGERSGDQ